MTAARLERWLLAPRVLAAVGYAILLNKSEWAQALFPLGHVVGSLTVLHLILDPGCQWLEGMIGHAIEHEPIKEDAHDDSDDLTIH